MPDPAYVFLRWWRRILLIVIVTLLLVGTIVFMRPRQYLSVVTALPASPVFSDKAAIFSDQVEALYPPLGGTDDVDRLVGTAQLDTVYLAVTDEFNLWDHYRLNAGSQFVRERAARLLRQNCRVYKSGYGELKIKVWDTDRNLAPQLANAFAEKLQELHQAVQQERNRAVLASLRSRRERLLSGMDSIAPERRAMANARLVNYEILIDQYETVVETKTAAFVLVEKASPAVHPDRPRRLRILAVSLFASLFFGFLLALFFERKKSEA
ncbi:MAG TPA: hypothetical protein VEB63_04740 [Chitinophagaceae bacterium]|nr:hypothetical protein [Chitinophagaceae bacterium]